MNARSFLLGLVVTSVAWFAMSAAQVSTVPGDPDPLAEGALEKIAIALERQAAAWEHLAQQGWPRPQQLTFTGDVPSRISVDLADTPFPIYVQLDHPGGGFDVNLSGSVTVDD